MSRFSTIDAESVSYLKSNIINGLNDSDNLIRSITGNVITSLFTQLQVSGWPEILSLLLNMIESSNDITKTSAMSALSKICEDSARQLNREYQGQRPLDYMIPKFLEFMTSSNQKVRSGSVFCINKFVEIKSQSFLPHIDAFLNNLFNLTSDNFSDTKINICSSLALILSSNPAKLIVHLDGILNYVLHCMADPEESVNTQACEFILSLADQSQVISDHVIAPFLPKIVPILLKAMAFSENDRILMSSLEEDDQDVEDRPEDIRPQFVKAKEHAAAKKANNESSANNNDEDDEDDEDWDEEDDIDQSMAEWNLRKCAAASLDTFSLRFPDQVLEVALPYLTTASVSDDAYVREAAILAFGAISQGCIDMMGPKLPELIPFLTKRLQDSEFFVRKTTCWTISRYSTWIAYVSFEEQNTQFLVPVLEALLGRFLDKNKKVQEAACSAFSIFTEECGELLAPYLEQIITVFASALNKYRAKNRCHLYDSIQTLFDKVPDATNTPQIANAIVPILYNLWQSTGDDDVALWQLMECFSSVTASVGMYMTQQAPSLYSRAVKIISEGIIMEQNHSIDPSVDVSDKEFEITALDLIDGLVRGLKENFSELAAQVQPPLAELIVACYDDETFEVRQSALALLGDLAMCSIKTVEPYLDLIITSTMKQINMAYTPSVCNNSIWALGEIIVQIQGGIKPYAEELCQILYKQLESEDGVSSVWENAACALGRLGQGSPETLAPHVGQFIGKWSAHIASVPENDEKDSAYLGMCKVVSQNPSGISDEQNLKSFIHVIVNYWEPSPQLAEAVRQILEGYRGMIPNWDSFVGALPEDSRNRIKQAYGL